MRIRHITHIALLVGVNLAVIGCAQQNPELSATNSVPSSTTTVADSSATPTDPPDQVAVRVVARTQDIVYAISDQIQNLIETDTTQTGRDALNDLVSDRIAPLRAALTQLPPGTTWYIVP